MPANWIKRPGHERIEHYMLRLNDKAHPSSGYAFDCDAEGSLLGNEYATKEEREQQLSEIIAAKTHDGPFFNDLSRDWFNPGSLRCHCGREHYLARGDSTCECGQDYNACGQELVPPHMWEENYEED